MLRRMHSEMIVIMPSLLVLIMFSFLFSFPFHYLLCFNLDIFFMFAIIRMIRLLVHKHIFYKFRFYLLPTKISAANLTVLFLFTIMDITLTERIHNAVPIIVPLCAIIPYFYNIRLKRQNKDSMTTTTIQVFLTFSTVLCNQAVCSL